MAKEILKRGATSNIIRVFLQDSASTTGAGKTTLTNTSTGLIISTIADNEATATTYTAAASNVETITTLGTFAAPTASKCRFKEVDSTNFPGVYEIQIADARFNVLNSTQLLVSVQCTGVAPVFIEYQLVTVDLMDATRLGLTALPDVAAGANGGLPTGNASGQVTVASLVAAANEAVADAVLSRDISVHNVEDAATQYTLCSVILGMLENEIVDTTLTIYKSDHSTTHVTKSLTTTAASSANVITEID